MYNQENCKFAKTHEWAFVEGDNAVIGISDHAQHEISDIVFVELPKIGAKIDAGKSCCVIESVKSASDIYAPLSGEVIEVNSAVADDPSVINREPHGNGWLFKIKIADKTEEAALLDFAAYEASLK
ncbi:Glycine cleavage system H protein [Elusimicrobium minutum Pei191]|uniref:Glycine cleavage system H protein n=1 Tax=Elusimicrobium minutum (strain Pei191) TaxID=445932 RepID=B2KEF7_ELUMP|nr:glycine cleavage system protein GcvH [Elusimicrobium minutum]ACC98903.1 Glycine cleavage system H protein [Elusimicrobium minutum Pei191]